MGIELEIFYLYKIISDENKETNVLIRCTRNEFPNYNQTKEDQANKDVESKKEVLLESFIIQNLGTNKENTKVEFLGEMQVNTFGDELYEIENKELVIYVADTEYGFPWIAIGQADSKMDFIKKMKDDEIYDFEIGILSLNPKVETIRKLKVELITDANTV
ncbi:hypothetical protein LV716_12935 [Flagellimonas sp. HMM57]|uniref:hypothetical protein n=1 Tax=unclassified Flagellimonas TaxID=2644544 RepID=UPI0013D7DCFB|nr:MULTISPECIES: hypothetical protein [unclassified Flagellimonas]UII75159.1 hypothetical protein LV716_12935 [Flagellimonas sp. HMM57]